MEMLSPVVADGKDDRRTPLSLFTQLDATHHFTVDVAANVDNHLCPRFYTRETDGLAQSWAGERVWCNPPFSDIAPWVSKAWEEMRNGCERIVMLIPANRCEQPWWQLLVEPFRDGRGPGDGPQLRTDFLRGRTRFSGPPTAPLGSRDGKGQPMFGCVLLTWGPTSR